MPSFYEVAQTDFGFIVATGREIVKDAVHWNLNIMLMPFHKIISTAPAAAHIVGAHRRRNDDALQHRFPPKRPLNESEVERARGGDWIHTENEPAAITRCATAGMIISSTENSRRAAPPSRASRASARRIAQHRNPWARSSIVRANAC